MSKVRGNKNGLVLHNNVSGKKSEPLVTIEKLKQTWLFGVKVRDKETGEDLGEEAYQNAIDTAVGMLETFLDISVSPVKNFKEYKDYHKNDYQEWGYMHLDNFPVECVQSIKIVYFRDQDGAVDDNQSITIPLSWIRLNNHDGIIRLVPNGRFPGNLQIGNSGFFPEIMRSQMIPHAWEVTYDYGFCDGMVPVLLNQAISMIAGIIILITAGHLVLGAGIASNSISLDGLSQAVTTTNSAENSAFSSTIKDISDKLYGKTQNDPFSMLSILKNYYKGSSMSII